MTIEFIIICVLIMIIIAQQMFFMWQVNKLVNKLMSRDFHSYAQTIKPPEHNLGGFTVQLPDEGHDRLAELNRSIQMPL